MLARDPWRSRCGAVALVALSGCSSGTAPAGTTPTAVVPIGGGGAVGSANTHPSSCDIAAALVHRADALRAEGRLARAARAVAEAVVRCPERAAELGRNQAASDAALALRPGESAEDIARRAGELAAAGDAAGGRREHERWLAAVESKAGSPMRLSVAAPSRPLTFQWTHDGKMATVVSRGEVAIYDGDLRTELGRHPVDQGVDTIAPFQKRHAAFVLDSRAPAPVLIDLSAHRGRHPPGHPDWLCPFAGRR